MEAFFRFGIWRKQQNCNYNQKSRKQKKMRKYRPGNFPEKKI